MLNHRPASGAERSGKRDSKEKPSGGQKTSQKIKGKTCTEKKPGF